MHVVVMGGSLGGLSVALWLRDAGCDVDVHERSHSPLEGRGAGIVLHPAVLRYFTQYRVLNFDRISAAVRCARYRARAGTVAHEVPARYRFTSWTALYQALLRCVDPDRYHLGNEIIGFNDDADGVNVRLEGGRCIRCDLLVCADGVMSTARQILLPGSAPQYAGYVAWRGTVEGRGTCSRTPGRACMKPSPIFSCRTVTFSRTPFPAPTTSRHLLDRSTGSGIATSNRATTSMVS